MSRSARIGMLGLISAVNALVVADPVSAEGAVGAPISAGVWWQMLAALVVGTLGQAAFAGLETGLYTVNRVRLRVRSSRREKPDLSARVLAGEVVRLPEVLPALLIGYNLAGALGSYGLTVLLTDQGGWGMGRWTLLATNLLVVTPVMFFLADMLPKEIFRADADRLMYQAAVLLRMWRLLLTYTGVLPAVQWLAYV
ncbi:MAG: CNNM domain-containing protein, partial [Phycisphaerales bacterium]|nr:CNNM domain-containing protein [Phycisphaerales bacterium]